MAHAALHPTPSGFGGFLQRWRQARGLAAAVVTLGLLSTAQAGPKAAAEAAWGCIKANGKAVVQGATTGVKVLEFIATKPLCVAQLVTPPPAIPQVAMGITVGIATQQKLTSYDSCSNRIYGFVAEPVLGAVKAALDEAPNLPPPLNSLKSGLAKLAADNAVELLTSIPGTEVVTGGIDCGCGLVEAGLQPRTVIDMVNTTKTVMKECADVLEELGPVGKGIVAVGGAVSTGWRDTINDPQHIPYQQYYDLFWAPQVEGLSQKLIQPGSQDWTPTVKPLWNNCVKYFNSHNQYESTAVVTCDSMRDGVHIFPQRGFTQAVSRRTWTLSVPGAVENFARHLAGQQSDLARAARLGPAVQQGLREVIFTDFGLTQMGTAPRDGNGDPQWVGSNTLGERAMDKMPSSVNGTTVINARVEADSSVISGAYNHSDLLAKVLRWQAAYPALQAAHCGTPPRIRVPGANTPPQIRVPGSALPRETLGCTDMTVPSDVRAKAASACKVLADDLKDQLVLSCPEASALQRPVLRVDGATYNGRVLLLRGRLSNNTGSGVDIQRASPEGYNFVARFGSQPINADWVSGVMGPKNGALNTLHFLLQVSPPPGFDMPASGQLLGTLVGGNNQSIDDANFTIVPSSQAPEATVDGVTVPPMRPRVNMNCLSDQCREEVVRIASSCRTQEQTLRDRYGFPLPQAREQELAALWATCDDKMRAQAARGIKAEPVTGIGPGRVPPTMTEPAGDPPATAPPPIRRRLPISVTPDTSPPAADPPASAPPPIRRRLPITVTPDAAPPAAEPPPLPAPPPPRPPPIRRPPVAAPADTPAADNPAPAPPVRLRLRTPLTPG